MSDHTMNTDPTTPIGETTTAAPGLPAAAAGPQTYEDCLVVLNGLDNETDIANLKAGISKFKAFLNQRIGKKNQKREQDGSTAVKTAIAGGRSFKKYEPRAMATPDANTKSPWS